MKRIWIPIAVLGVMLIFPGIASPKERVQLSPDTPKSQIIYMNPAEVDPSLLPLDDLSRLNTTGIPPENLDITTWRLEVKGQGVKTPLSLSYEDLLKMPTVKRKVLLICPGFFADYAEWEGVPLGAVFEKAQVEGPYQRIRFVGLDGYETFFSAEEVAGEKMDLLFLALRVNGETLPPEHGFPVRLVAEDFYGSRWVKWIREIVVE